MDQQTVKLLRAEARKWYKTHEANWLKYGGSTLEVDKWGNIAEFLEAYLDGT